MMPAHREVWSLRFWGPAGGAVSWDVATDVGQIGMIMNALRELSCGRWPRGGQTSWLGGGLCQGPGETYQKARRGRWLAAAC